MVIITYFMLFKEGRKRKEEMKKNEERNRKEEREGIE
jgi:preprotein translocase subunit YajC